MSEKQRVAVIIPAAGSGTRMGAKNKLLLPLAGRPLLLHTIEAFETSPLVTHIILAVSPHTSRFYDENIKNNSSFSKMLPPVRGGATRQDSVRAALCQVCNQTDMVLVHDGARPLVSHSLIEAIIEKAAETGAAVPVVRLKDTIKKVCGNRILETVRRESLRAVQTPQGFETALLQRAFDEAEKKDFTGTDEASLVEALGHTVHTVPGSYENLKITTPEDLTIAEALLKKRLT